MSYCKTCSTKYDEEMRYCKICGSILIPNDKNENIPNIPSPTDQLNATISHPIKPKSSVLTDIPGSDSEKNMLIQKSNMHIPFLKSIKEALNKTILNVSILKPLAIIILLFFMITGGYWGYIKFISIDEKAINTELIASHQEVKMQSSIQTQEQVQVEEKNAGLNQVFEIIRKANITKNIDLFMTCYSPKFKSLSYKRADRLKIWNNYDYNSLKYDVKGFIILKDKASGLVEWKFYARCKNLKRSISSTALYNVILEKDNEGSWKILCLTKL